MLKVNLLITGFPGCGKSTLVNRVVDRAKQDGLKVGGISTPEFRLGSGRRGGFLIRDIATGAEQVMAAVDISSPVKVGHYGVNLNAIREIGVIAIDYATTSTELIVIDEIGKMELAVPEFQRAVIRAFDSPKPLLGTIGLKLKTHFVNQIKNRNDVTILTLTPEKRTTVFQQTCTLMGL
ncbi:MAG: NTPase [Promethearchaeota archaeon]